jgi:hypothetical protein
MAAAKNSEITAGKQQIISEARHPVIPHPNALEFLFCSHPPGIQEAHRKKFLVGAGRFAFTARRSGRCGDLA